MLHRFAARRARRLSQARGRKPGKYACPGWPNKRNAPPVVPYLRQSRTRSSGSHRAARTLVQSRTKRLSHSRITGIEIDSITARLAKQLYPDAEIRHQPFEETRLADSFFDVAISNIPFGDYRPFDARFKRRKFVIHDYFFAATLEKVRPGGLVIFVTSKGTLDKVEGGLRELLSQQADLLGAIRLPNDAFKKNANTKVTTDIVMLRKRLPGEGPKGPAWKALGEITNSEGETISLNEYFVAHPEMMLGEMRCEGRMYRQAEPTLVGNGRDLAEQLAEVIALLPRDVFTPHRKAVRPPTLEQTVPAPENIKPNAYAVVNDHIGIREGNTITILEALPPARAQRIRGLLRVGDAVRRCLRTQLESADETSVENARYQYDRSHRDNRFGPKPGVIKFWTSVVLLFHRPCVARFAH